MVLKKTCSHVKTNIFNCIFWCSFSVQKWIQGISSKWKYWLVRSNKCDFRCGQLGKDSAFGVANITALLYEFAIQGTNIVNNKNNYCMWYDTLFTNYHRRDYHENFSYCDSVHNSLEKNVFTHYLLTFILLFFLGITLNSNVLYTSKHAQYCL